MRRLSPLVLVLLANACSSTDNGNPAPGPAAAGDAGPTATIVADLRADSNRDGEVRFDDTDAIKTVWDAKTGAVFLANIDDDKGRCPKKGNDADLPGCNDATNEVIDGADDVLDLARLKTKPWAEAPDSATAIIAITTAGTASAKDVVRLFKKTGDGAADFTVVADGDAITAEELRAGVELAIEGKDIVRDTKKWDGFVDVKLTVTVDDAHSADDTVRMRVAPVMTYHHLLAAEQVFVTNNGDPGNKLMRTDLAAATTGVGLPTPTLIPDQDPWAQDFFETAFMSMPGAGGVQHVVDVALRSANVYDPTDAKNPLRPAGQVVFSMLRGKDHAAVQQFDIKHDQNSDSLNSFGNLETIPPYTLADKTYPLGRIFRGNIPSFGPDPTFIKMMESQSMQPPVYIDTSWLLVGHVDETMSFVKASTPRGWALLVNDPTIAKKMLEDQVTAGNGATKMFIGESWYDNNGAPSPAETTISAVLADTTVMTASADAATEVDAQLTIMKKETGLTDAEIIKVPFLHTSTQGGSYAYIPGMVNGILISDKDFVVPNPHGPVVAGKDIFQQTMIDRLAPLGITVHFAEDWDEYHAALGEVHCGTNTRRKIPETKWWETGR
jgi:protein-arginine deiminase